MLSLIGSLGGAIISGVSGWFKRRQVRKQAVVDKKHELKMAKLGARVARYEADAQAASETRQQDQEYDLQVLKNRRESWIDEVIILAMIAVVIMHFIPFTQPFMAAGWAAMGYTGMPWWCEFAIVGIFISTLGLLKVFRFWMGRWGASKASK